MAKNIFKILLMGLDYAGKTSILLTLAGDYEPAKIKPTMGADRSEINVLGFPIIRWDLGGQEQYRQNYLQKRSRILDDTDLLFFVVDITDKARYKEALMYYIDILNYFQEVGLMPEIVILIHKADPEFFKTPDCKDAIKELITLFKNKSQDFDVQFFITSIFNRKSLFDAFSHSILQLIPKLNALDTMLQTFIVDAELDAALLFDENFFIVGNAYKPATKEVVLQAINGIYFLFEDLIRVREAGYELELNLRKIEQSNELQFLFRRVVLGTWNLYLLIVGKEIVDVRAILEVLNRNYDSMKTFFKE
ncbi:MAG: ADP-ribosylation factor-like protein [Candidatus Helarchaeota archaeon]